jgi:tetratricopeptide (TPR) repeat protein
MQKLKTIAMGNEFDEFNKLIEKKKAADRRQRKITLIIILNSIVLILIISYSTTIKQKENIALTQKLDTAQVVQKQKDSLQNKLTEIKTHLDSVSLANEQLNLGVIYATSKRPSEAINAYSRSIALDPNNSIPYNLRGYLYFVKGDYDKAVFDLENSIKIDSNDIWGHYNLALAYFAINDTIRAFSEVKKIIYIDSSFYEVIKNDDQFKKFKKISGFNTLITKRYVKAPN